MVVALGIKLHITTYFTLFIGFQEDGSKSCGFSLVFSEEVKDVNISHALHTLQKMHTADTGETELVKPRSTHPLEMYTVDTGRNELVKPPHPPEKVHCRYRQKLTCEAATPSRKYTQQIQVEMYKKATTPSKKSTQQIQV